MSYAKASTSTSRERMTPNGEPVLQASLPPSPIDEQDLGGVSPFQHGFDDEEDTVRSKKPIIRLVNGKGKAKDLGDEDEWEDGAVDANEQSGERDMHYPPTKEDEEESKKIEDNLRRWEHAERQRRKAARERERGESISANRSSIVGDVSKRASILWSNKRKSTLSNAPAPPRGLGHTALGTSSDDALPLSDMGSNGRGRTDVYSPGPSVPASPNPDASSSNSPILDRDSTSSQKTVHAPVPTIAISENPFEPPGSATPLRGFDAGQEVEDEVLGESAVMAPRSPPPPTPAGSREQEKSPFDDPSLVVNSDRPTLQATSSFSGPGSHPLAQPPSPKPIDIPPPKTPPPRHPSEFLVQTPPRPKLQPTVRRGPNGEEEEEGKRWFTDWLCGCRESYRDNQGGRTNPFE